jgi:ribokinase
VKVKEIKRASGGTAANVAVAAARILGKGRVAFIGALGDDEIADKQKAILREEGVLDSGIVSVPEEESGQAYIMVDFRGQNKIHTYFGANLKITDESLKDLTRLKLIQDAKIAVITDPPLETAKTVVKICKRNGIIVIWDPGVYTWKGLNELEPILLNVDYLVLNQLEFENLLGTCEPKEVIKALNRRIKGIKAIIKKGEGGSTLIGNEFIEPIDIPAIPIERLGMRVVNTVGCGDAFIGGFSAAKVEGMKDIEALMYGNAAGSFKATRKETRGGPTREELLELMERGHNLSL